MVDRSYFFRKEKRKLNLSNYAFICYYLDKVTKRFYGSSYVSSNYINYCWRHYFNISNYFQSGGSHLFNSQWTTRPFWFLKNSVLFDYGMEFSRAQILFFPRRSSSRKRILYVGKRWVLSRRVQMYKT